MPIMRGMTNTGNGVAVSLWKSTTPVPDVVEEPIAISRPTARPQPARGVKALVMMRRICVCRGGSSKINGGVAKTGLSDPRTFEETVRIAQRGGARVLVASAGSRRSAHL